MLWRLRLRRAAPVGCVLAGRVSLHRGAGGPGGVVVGVGLRFEGWLEVGFRLEGGRRCAAMLSGRLEAV